LLPFGTMTLPERTARGRQAARNRVDAHALTAPVTSTLSPAWIVRIVGSDQRRAICNRSARSLSASPLHRPRNLDDRRRHRCGARRRIVWSKAGQTFDHRGPFARRDRC